MHYGVERRPGKHGVELVAIADIALDEINLGRNGRDVAAAQIIVYSHLVPCPHQRLHNHTSNVSCTTGN